MATSGEFFGSPVQLAIQEAALTPADTLTVEKISGMIPDNYAVDARVRLNFFVWFVLEKWLTDDDVV